GTRAAGPGRDRALGGARDREDDAGAGDLPRARRARARHESDLRAGAPVRGRRHGGVSRGLLPAHGPRPSPRPRVRRHDARRRDRPHRMAGARGPLGAAARPALPPGLRSGTGYPRTGGDSVSGYWLAIDTATEIASVAVGRRAGAGPVQSETGAHAQGARRHASEIVRLVDFALAGLGIRPADLSGIVLGDGPGSFTGLRIGWAAAKGLAQEAGLDLVAVPSLMAAAAVPAWSAAAPVPPAALPPAASVLLSLFTREGAARVITDPVTAEPVYGRLAEAQVKWEARHGRPLPDPSRPRG